MARQSKKRFSDITIRPEYTKAKQPVKITVIDYDENNFQQKEVTAVEECFVFRDKPTVTWINVDGIYDAVVIEKLATCFGLHPLILEDISDVEQRPKMEDLGSYLYIVIKMLSYDASESEVSVEQMSMILGTNFVISFQETVGDAFDPIRERIKNNKGRHRKMGADYLAYSLIDAIVDNYYNVFDEFGERIEFLEDEVISRPDPQVLKEIYNLKREIIFLRKSIWPLRELIRGLERSETSLIKETTKIYLRDIYDHVIQIIDSMEVFREMLTGMIEMYLSSLSNRLNEVMKVLTIIATIFMPLTFLTGIFGMNFRFIPGLEHVWGFPASLLIMIITALVMLRYFQKRQWM